MKQTALAIIVAIVLAGLCAVLYQQHRLDKSRLDSLGDRVTELSDGLTSANQTLNQLRAEQTRLNQIAARQAASELEAAKQGKQAAQGVKDDYKAHDQALASRSVPDSVAERVRSAAVSAEAAGVVTAPADPRIYDDVLPGAGGAGSHDSGTADAGRAGGDQLAGNLQRQDAVDSGN
ncbi:hypothetical protein SUSUWATARI_00140 [Serratia phage vB_SmaM-Susuwatari]|nr:hypothetical protein SUSUWATARI_00140 [Serratia phage vB_SmaM-Susuwatari]